MTAPPFTPPAGETGFESFEAPRATLFEILCRSYLFWFVLGIWAGSSVGLGLGFLLGVEAVVPR